MSVKLKIALGIILIAVFWSGVSFYYVTKKDRHGVSDSMRINFLINSLEKTVRVINTQNNLLAAQKALIQQIREEKKLESSLKL